MRPSRLFNEHAVREYWSAGKPQVLGKSFLASKTYLRSTPLLDAFQKAVSHTPLSMRDEQRFHQELQPCSEFSVHEEPWMPCLAIFNRYEVEPWVFVRSSTG